MRDNDSEMISLLSTRVMGSVNLNHETLAVVYIIYMVLSPQCPHICTIEAYTTSNTGNRNISCVMHITLKPIPLKYILQSRSLT